MQKSDQLESPMEPLEIYEHKKIFAFKGLIISFIAWQLGQIMLNNFTGLLHSSVTMTFQFLNLFGGLSWAGFIFYFMRISGFLKENLNLKSQVNDERASLIRLRALSYGFTITLGVTSLFYCASFLFDSFAENYKLGGTLVAQSIILVAVSSALISYLILDKEE